MRYWPISTIARSPLLSETFTFEVANMHRWPPSVEAFHKCFEVARQTAVPAMHGLVFIESTDASPRQVFSEYPSWGDWFRLERAAVIEKNGFYFIVIDTLH